MNRLLNRLLTTNTLWIAVTLFSPCAVAADGPPTSRVFVSDDIFELEWAKSPDISPDGQQVVWVRAGFTRLTDQPRGHLWITDVTTGLSQPLVAGQGSYDSPLFSPDGKRLVYTARESGNTLLMMHWLDSGREMRVAQLEFPPEQVAWSPDGKRLAFSMFAPEKGLELSASKARKPNSAVWAEPMSFTDNLVFRFDGRGFLQEGANQIYVVSSDGGTPSQVSNGSNDFSDPSWSSDSQTLYFVGNEAERAELDPIETEIYVTELSSGKQLAITNRDGPDHSPKVAPNGGALAWLGYDDERVSYQQTELYLRLAEDKKPKLLTASFDHSLSKISWSSDSQTILAQATVMGQIHLVEIDMQGGVKTVIRSIGGTNIGRPYASGDHAVVGVGEDRVIAWTLGRRGRPADLMIKVGNGAPRTVTDLNSDLLNAISAPRIIELQVPSKLDGLNIEAWVAIPKNLEPDGSAPMILEIHGGPFAMYTDTFAAEIQRYAAEGYVTVWANPRGSTGYGESYARAIDQNYPGPDHDDLMSVVDKVVELGWVNPDRLFITGGSGGGVLTAYATGMTDRFAAAAVIKPVINWFTMALAADIGVVVSRHWVRAEPWKEPQKYFDLSPIRVVGNVTTPTLVMVGEEDWRTPAWEAEQWYTALKMQGVPAAYVRVPGASHSIAARPSNMAAKVDTIMAWFARFDPQH